MKYWTNKLHVWTLKWANTKRGTWAIFLCAFADASFLPLPTPMFFILLSLLNIKKAYLYAFYGTFGSLLGAVVGYSIGHFAWIDDNGEFSALAQLIFNYIPGFSETIFNTIQMQFEKWDFLVLFIASLLPIPYKIFSISSGVFNINIVMFCIATLISQGLKFFLFALLTIKIGPEVKKIIDYKIKPVFLIVAACVILLIVIIKIL
jgi:membrane protein YqaA with SNARE-associated domain